MVHLPTYIPLVFIFTTLLTVNLFCRSSKNPKKTYLVIALWLAVQTVVGLTGFYTVTDNIPPRFMLLVIPPLIVIIGLLLTASGRRYLDAFDLRRLTIVHIIRIPVELVLLWLAIYKMVPLLMTFEGKNMDVLSGISAPFIFYFGFKNGRMHRKLLLIWNIVCIGLLFNIIALAVLSAPFPFQRLAFDQPNVAVLYFPYFWLPCCVVPLVLLSHLVAIRKVLTEK